MFDKVSTLALYHFLRSELTFQGFDSGMKAVEWAYSSGSEVEDIFVVFVSDKVIVRTYIGDTEVKTFQDLALLYIQWRQW